LLLFFPSLTCAAAVGCPDLLPHPQMLDEFLQQRKVPVSLRTRIREFFVFTSRRQLSPDDASLVEGAGLRRASCSLVSGLAVGCWLVGPMG